MVDYTAYAYLFLTLIFFIVSIVFYTLFLYIPTAEFEDEFNDLADQADGILRSATNTANQIEETNNLVQDGFTSFCESYNSFSQIGIVFRFAFGNAFEDVCEGVES